MSLNKSSALPIQAHMTNCQVAIALQEDFTLTYGSSIGLQKDYNVRQLMFNTGGTSGGGHFITANRLRFPSSLRSGTESRTRPGMPRKACIADLRC